MKATTPPVTAKSSLTDPEADASNKSTLLMMGFPSRITEEAESFCACHSKPTKGGYLCSRCSSKVCALPATCPACGLTLILSTHLARSYHHLFPLRNWSEVSWKRATAEQKEQSACFGCLTPFPAIPSKEVLAERRAKGIYGERGRREGGVSESGRYACGSCGRFFCIDCDVFAHEVVHNCPGCLSREGEQRGMDGAEGTDGDVVMGEAETEDRRAEKGKGKAVDER